MAARQPFWKWRRWKSIGFCLWPPSTCIWNLKLKFQREHDLCSGNHVVYRQTDGRTDGRTMWIQYTHHPHPHPPPPTSLGGGIIIPLVWVSMASFFPGKWWQWTRQVFCCSSCDSVQNCVPQVLWSPEYIFPCFMRPVPMNPIWFPALMFPRNKFYITYIPL